MDYPSYVTGNQTRNGFFNDLQEFIPLGLFDAKIVSRSENKNEKGRYFYYIQFSSRVDQNASRSKKALVTSEYFFEPGQYVSVDLINWRDQNTRKYSLFLTLIPPINTPKPEVGA